MTKPTDNEKFHMEQMDAAIAKVKAKLAIMESLKNLSGGKHEAGRVLVAVRHVLDADAAVPGVMDAFLRGLSGKQS